MGKIIEKVKETVTGAKDKVKDVGETTKDKVTSSTSSKDTSSSSRGSAAYEQGAAGTEIGINDDPLTSYREKEPMTPAKIKEHEPTAVRRDSSDQKIVEPGQTGTNPEEAAEIARKKGMAKGTAGAAETGSEYEQGAAGSNKQEIQKPPLLLFSYNPESLFIFFLPKKEYEHSINTAGEYGEYDFICDQYSFIT